MGCLWDKLAYDENVTLTKRLSLAAQEVIKTTTSGAAIDEIHGKFTFPFASICHLRFESECCLWNKNVVEVTRFTLATIKVKHIETYKM